MPALMKVWAVDRPGPVDDGPLVQVDKEVPRPGPGQVLVRVRACGVCRTDLHLTEGDLAPRRPLVTPGHEVVGIVEQLGSGSTRWRVGDRIGVPWLAHTCGMCRVLSIGTREPLPRSALHRLGPRRGVCALHGGRRGLCLRAARELRRRRGRAVALRRDHRLSRPAARQPPRRRPPRDLRVRRLGPHHGAGRVGPGRPRPRLDPVARSAAAGARNWARTVRATPTPSRPNPSTRRSSSLPSAHWSHPPSPRSTAGGRSPSPAST